MTSRINDVLLDNHSTVSMSGKDQKRTVLHCVCVCVSDCALEKQKIHLFQEKHLINFFFKQYSKSTNDGYVCNQ